MWCGLLLAIASVAGAEVLRVDAMRLAPEAAWRRGDPAREREDGAYLLEWPVAANGFAPQVAIPLHSTPLRSDAETFYANLRKKWAHQYGPRAEIGRIEIAGAHWLACRRRASDGETVVFLLAGARAGRAYSVLAFAAPHASGLPKPVYDLLATADFGEVARRWSARRVIAERPDRAALASMLDIDMQRIGQDGMLTGYGLRYTRPEGAEPALRLEWFLDGFTWRQRVGRDEREPFALKGALEARATAGALRLAAASDAAVDVEVGLLDLCAPKDAIEAALAQLADGHREALERLLRERPPSCPALAATPPRFLRVVPGQPLEETLAFPTGQTVADTAGLDSLRVLFLRPRLAPPEGLPGQHLLHAAGLYFIYAQE